MKHSEIRKFVSGYLNHQGATVTPKGSSLLEVVYPAVLPRPEPTAPAGSVTEPKPAPAIEQLLAFGRKAHKRNPKAELVAIGSAYLDQLIGKATAGGHRFVSYRPIEPIARMPKLSTALPTLEGGSWGKVKLAYRPLFLFVYIAEYRTIDVPDDMELIPLDPVRGVMLASAGPLLDGLNSLSDTPESNCRPLGTLPTPGTVKRSLEILDRRLLRRTRKVKEAASLEIARETANIEAYYRQLIDEVRHPVGRSRLSTEAEEERVRTLQLDWKRRVQEVAQFWEAGASVRLSALGVVMEPCWVMQLRGKGIPRGGGGRCPICLVFDYKTGELITPRCPICNARIEDRAELAGLDLICVNHGEDVDQTKG
jgi:hypothetical protein